MKQKHFINWHKGITFLTMIVLISLYGRWQNPTALIYLALHGTYGLLWVLKSQVFPDKAWEQPTGWGYGLVIWGSLTLYWIGGWLITSQDIQAPPWLLAVCVSLYTLGVFFHFSADMQKYTSLKLNPGRLITDEMFAFSRNINYFGELLIYLGFGLLAMHWLPIVVIFLFFIFYWWPNMRKKDKSLSRYPTFTEYKDKTPLFWPKVRLQISDNRPQTADR